MSGSYQFACLCGNGNEQCFVRESKSQGCLSYGECVECGFPCRERESEEAKRWVVLLECQICSHDRFLIRKELGKFVVEDAMIDCLVCLQCDGLVPYRAYEQFYSVQDLLDPLQISLVVEEVEKVEKEECKPCVWCQLGTEFRYEVMATGAVVATCKLCDVETVILEPEEDVGVEDVEITMEDELFVGSKSQLEQYLCPCGAGFEQYHLWDPPCYQTDISGTAADDFHLISVDQSRLICGLCHQQRAVDDLMKLRELVEEAFCNPVPGKCRRQTRVNSIHELAPGDHVSFRRALGYWHHGVVVEVNNKTKEYTMVHYFNYTEQMDRLERGGGMQAKSSVSGKNLAKGMVRRDTQVLKPESEPIYKVEYHSLDCFIGPVVVERAVSRLGESEYNVFKGNCEHFATWCKTGVARSWQVEKVLDWLKNRLVEGLRLLSAKLSLKTPSSSRLRLGARVATVETAAMAVHLGYEYRQVRRGAVSADCWRAHLQRLGIGVVGVMGQMAGAAVAGGNPVAGYVAGQATRGLATLAVNFAAGDRR